ncbi:hypothetical protein QA652_24940, partial [Klebsiella pneumoniae]|nr:hypothetical protein [Klebsiella pneumoniae]
QLLGNTQNSRHRYAASTSGNPSFSVLRQLQYLCELTHIRHTVWYTASNAGRFYGIWDNPRDKQRSSLIQ